MIRFDIIACLHFAACKMKVGTTQEYRDKLFAAKLSSKLFQN